VLFNSLDYLVFLPAVVALYFLCPQRARWALLLGASYLFYAAWKVEYLALIIASTVVDYGAGLAMGACDSRRARRKWLGLSLLVNLGLLFVFKYANFASESAQLVSERLGLMLDFPTLQLLLPVGISFYTFQTLSYSVDVYRGVREPERHLGKFAVYVAFFPQLVAGPIERSTRLLPQFAEHHSLDWTNFHAGLWLILWGFFKKLVVADQAGIYVDAIFGDATSHGAIAQLCASYLFAFQLYCDFSGYSDIAIGSAQLMGYRLMDNFRRPYFAQTVQDFWRRWHVSLSTWFRDYVYLPLGGSRGTTARWAAATAVVFLTSGLWHGANWTFVVWGALHVVYMFCGAATRDVRAGLCSALPSALQRCLPLGRAVFVFHLWAFSLIFFRSANIGDAFGYMHGMAAGGWDRAALLAGFSPVEFCAIACAPLVLMALEIWHGERGWLPFIAARSFLVRLALGAVLFFAILLLGPMNSQTFIYFQF
jgi:D-alanyl-lipoteichoic acid acyltransferase DltB (MBOAT superfamily)